MESSTRPVPADIPPSHPHPGWIITAAIESLRTLVWALVPLLFSVRDQGAIAMIAVTATFGLAVVIWRAIQWHFITYSAESGSISLNTGALSKSHKSVRPERVQAIDTVEPPIGRLLGISELRISTAGSGETIVIPAVRNAEANRLRDWIEFHRAGNEPSSTEVMNQDSELATGSAILRKLSSRDVLLAGLTSGRIAPALALTAFGVRIVTELLPNSLVDRIPFDPERLTPFTIVAIVGIAAVAAWGISIAGSVITNWNFTLERSGDTLIISSGLLERQRNAINVQRVQGLTIVEGLLRQPFGYASITIESAAPRRKSDAGIEQYQLIPLIRMTEIRDFIAEALPEMDWIAEPRSLATLPARARRRYLAPVVRDLGSLAIIASLLIWQIERGEWWYGISLLALIPPLLIYADLQFRDAGWSCDSMNHLVIRTRSVDRQTTCMHAKRVQMRELAQDWLQRRADLATVTLLTAAHGGRSAITLRHVDESDGSALMDALQPQHPWTSGATSIVQQGAES